jgi:hypothetical protein
VRADYRKPVMHVKGIMTGVRPAWNGSFERGKALSFSSGLSGGKRKKSLKNDYRHD